MKIPSFLTRLGCAVFVATLSSVRADADSPARAAAAAPAVAGPHAAFAVQQYVFGRIMAGDVVKFDFVFTNTGDQTLEISKVQPSCGCTRAGEYTHQVEPGKTGHIPIQFNSGNFHGDVVKSITVTSNDKLSPMQSLTLKGTIWKQLDMNPQYTSMTVVPDEGSNATTTIHVTNHGDDPVTISDPKTSSPTFTAELKTVEPGKKWDILVTAVPPFTNPTTRGEITVKTSVARMPMLTANVYVVSRSPVTLVPAQMFLPALIDRWTTNTVSVMVNGSRPMSLSDPDANDKRVSVQLRVVDPGRRFLLAAAFPPGYQTSQGQRVQLTVKSDNRSQPIITVPVNQLSRRAGEMPTIASH
jgi:hypothetical protein